MTERAQIPSGTITLLFTDIQGSTRLWEAEPDAMTVALRRHDDILRSSIESAGGYVFKTVGDSFCAAFVSAPAAISAVLEAQSSVGVESWPTSRPVLVRMGLHTGVCEERDGDYFGPVVNRAARLEAVAHGGQVLISGATAELLAGQLPTGVSLTDLGSHRLKDLGRPEQVFQLAAPPLASAFPPLPTLDNPELPNNLPAMLSAFVGRDSELAEIRQFTHSARLVTLTGAGGSGKTRLALQVAAELLGHGCDGAWFADLAPVADPSQVAVVVATVLGLPDAGQARTDRVIQALSGQDVLIVMDNCEHLIDTTAKFCDEVLQQCPKVRMLVTSREPLGIDGEQVYRVPSLSLPAADIGSAEELAHSDAARLFAERARATDARFLITDQSAPLVASLCRRLDGIPLALELAAARLSSMSLQQVSDRLDRRFRLLTGGSRNAMPRQQTLQATVEWSFGLLNPAERETLLRLGVFSGGFDLAAAEAVCASDTVDEFDVLDLLRSLVDKSLVVADRDDETVRYRLLETIRQYAAETLLATDGEDGVLAIRDRHARYYLSQAEQAWPELNGPGQREWMRRLDADWDNIQAAFAHFEAAGQAAEIMRQGSALARYLISRGRTECAGWLRRAIAAADVGSAESGPAESGLSESGPGEVPPRLVAAALITICWLVAFFNQTDRQAREQVRRDGSRALQLARQAGDRGLEALAVQFSRPAPETAEQRALSRQLHDEAVTIARQTGDDHLLAMILGYFGHGSPAEMVPGKLEALELFRRAGDDLGTAAMLVNVANGYLAEAEGDVIGERLAEREAHLDEAIALLEPLGDDTFLAFFLMDRALMMLLCEQYEQAEPLVRRCLVNFRRMGLLFAVGEALFGAAAVASWHGHLQKAACLFGAASAEIGREVKEGVLTWSPAERQMEEREASRLRDVMGEQAYDDAFLAGGQLTVAEAIALALGPG